MDAKRWAAIESLYHAALEKEPCDRSSYLAAACAEDPTLRDDIESLLAYAEARLSGSHRHSEMVEPADQIAVMHAYRPSASGESELTGTEPATTALPSAIGGYRIVRLLGEGGMGTVYEAEQEHPQRTVALKVIKTVGCAPELLRRFEQESRVLGRLQHPGIAQIYAAGTAGSGTGMQPYFAMELIRGQSLLRYAQMHQLNTRQRLELITKVCEAVHHAHQRGIIHRDLKPGNILVDESGQPKVLDFGVARVTDSDARATRHTDVGRLVGTLAYMSPEQVLADPLELDTRTDVYSLGVILYELLAGRLPYNVSRDLLEGARTIRIEDPAPLSSISRTYKGDIETIAAKALEKDKTRRYTSAASIAGDIQRYLNDEPIVARPASVTYQLHKFARRHRSLVAGVMAVFVVLIAGIVVSTAEATRARRAERIARRAQQAALRERDRAATAEQRATQERDRALSAEQKANAAEARTRQERNRATAAKRRADTESATAKAVNDFLRNDLLAQAGASAQARPDSKPDPDLKVRTALDRAASRIEGKFKAKPLVEAAIRQTLGKTYEDLGLYREAQPHTERAFHLRRCVLGEEHPDTLTTMHDLAHLYWLQGKDPKAEPLLTRLLKMRVALLGEEHPDTLDAINDLGTLYVSEGKFAQAEPLHAKVLNVVRRLMGEEHKDTLTSMSNLGTLYVREGKFAQAEPLLTRALEGRVRVLGEEHPEALASMNNLAFLYRAQGRYAEAEPLLVKAVAIKVRVLGQEHPDTLASMNNLGRLYWTVGKYAQAESLLTKTLETKRRVLGAEHPDTLISMNNLGMLYENQGKYAQAEPILARALEVRRRVLGPDHPETLVTMDDLAELYQREARYAQAEALLREALNGHRKTLPDSWQRYNCESLLGASMASQKKYVEAEPLLLSGYEGMLERNATIPASNRSDLENAGKRIVELYQGWRKPEKAEKWREKLHLTTPAGIGVLPGVQKPPS